MSGRRSSDGYMPFFSAPPVNSGIIDAIYKPTDPEFRRNINLKLVGWMYDNYLLKFMTVECADIIKKISS